MHACKVEQNHHHQTKDDVFLCIPPLYHTGAKMHWFGSLLTGGRAVLLKGVNPETILETISREKCTIVWLLVPWHWTFWKHWTTALSVWKTMNSPSGG